jgi:hypothetical protein
MQLRIPESGITKCFQIGSLSFVRGLDLDLDRDLSVLLLRFLDDARLPKI